MKVLFCRESYVPSSIRLLLFSIVSTSMTSYRLSGDQSPTEHVLKKSCDIKQFSTATMHGLACWPDENCSGCQGFGLWSPDGPHASSGVSVASWA